MDKRLIMITALVVISVFVVTGCGQPQRVGSKKQTPEGTEFPTNIIDDMGREVTIQEYPKRIVSLAPSNTEILFALGLDDEIVGVTDYCNYPGKAKTKEKVGSFSEPNIEKIVSLEPDIVFATSMHQKAVTKLENLGIPVFVLNPADIDDILVSINKTGRVLGCVKAAQTLTRDMENRIEGVKQKTSKIKEEDKPLVYFELWDDPLMSAGPGSFVDNLIRLAGGINLAGDAKGTYPKVSEEVIIEKNPDIIIHQYDHGSNKISNISDRTGWENIKAVRENRIYSINPDIVNRAGPRIVEALEKFLQIIHPELTK